MNKYEENVYKSIFEYPTKKIVELELENEKLEKENQQLKKQKDDVVEYIKHYINFRKDIYPYIDIREFDLDKVLRMLGEGNV